MGLHFLPALIEARSSGQQVIANPDVFPFTGDFNEVRLAVLPYTFFSFSGGFSLGPSARELYSDRTLAPLAPYAPMLVTLGLLYGGLLLSGLIATHRQGDSWILLGLWMSIPILGVFGIATLLNIYYDVRYVATAFPAYILLLAAGIIRTEKTRRADVIVGSSPNGSRCSLG